MVVVVVVIMGKGLECGCDGQEERVSAAVWFLAGRCLIDAWNGVFMRGDA